MRRTAPRNSVTRILSIAIGTALGLTGVVAISATGQITPAAAAPSPASGLRARPGDPVTSMFLVSVDPAIPARERAQIRSKIQSAISRMKTTGRPTNPGRPTARVVRSFGEGTFNGFLIEVNLASAALLEAELLLEGLAAGEFDVEQDQVVERPTPDSAVINSASFRATQTNAPWGLDRLDQTALPLDGSYTDKGPGSGVIVYVVDTGVFPHSDFGGRVSSGFDVFTGGNGTADGNGHGTHVAGTIAGATYGVAKGATIVPVRVLDDNGSGTSSGVIAGLDWIRSNHPAGVPGVVNMSLGGGASASLDSAVTSLINAGFVVAVAAGNSNTDACNVSPARAAGAVTVGATTNTDARASYSNFGTCLDLFAPGSGIPSTWYTGGTATLSGTSMATPHVAGAAAVLWGTDPTLTASTVVTSVAASVTPGAVTSAGTGSPANLLYLQPPSSSTPSPSPTPSDPSTPAPSQPTAPGAPSGVAASANNDRATITWAAPVSDGGATITSYRVTGSSGQSCTWLSGPLTCTIRDLPVGQHTFTVTATNSVGTSVASAPSNSVTSTLSNRFFKGARQINSRNGTLTDDNRQALTESGEPGVSDGTRQATLWFVYTAPATGTLEVGTEGSTFDTVLDVFAPAEDLTGLSLLAENDDHTEDDGTFVLTSALTYDVERGQSVYLRVASFDGSVGDVALRWSLTEDPITVRSLTPDRLVDTRSGIGGVRTARVGALNGGGTPLSVPVLGRAGIPSSGVAAVSVNLTVTDTTANAFGGYVTAYPCGTAVPNASNVNFTTGQTVANAAIVPVGTDGSICVDVYGLANVIIDVNGAVLADTGFSAIAPTRRADTRSGIGGVTAAPIGGSTILRMPMLGRSGIPASGVSAVSMNVTATNTVAPDEGGYVTVYPCDGTVPNVSNINFVTAQTVPNAVTTPLSADGELCVFVYGRADIIIDVNGVYTADARFGAVAPYRITDTRTDGTVLGELDGAGDDYTIQVTGRGGVPATGVSAVAVNVTVTSTVAGPFGGYVTVYPCDAGLPNVSTLNFTTGQIIANAAVAPLSVDGELCVHVFGKAAVIVDVTGYIAG